MNSEHIPNGQVSEAEKLGRFGHHPDPAIDFEIEVQSLEARLFDAKGGISKPGTEPETVETVGAAIQRAMTFTVGGDPSAVAAKAILRNLEKEAWDYVHAKVTDDLQALGEEFGVLGGENRISGLRRVLTEMRSALTRRSSAGVKGLEVVARLHRKDGLGPVIERLDASWEVGSGLFDLYAVKVANADGSPVAAVLRPSPSVPPDCHEEYGQELIATLEWYGEQARLCRLIHSGGDSGRQALAADGGKRAAALIASRQPTSGETE